MKNSGPKSLDNTEAENSMSEAYSIFILKSQAGTLSQAENFLRNRSWIVGSSTNLRDALAYIIQKKPQYVFLSSDHPNKKVRMLPKMLVQAFPVRVIGFAERGTGLSTKHLTEMALEYNLYPPVSGPAIERMVLKIRKDDETKAHEAANPKAPRGNANDGGAQDNITFKCEVASSEDMKASFEQARAALAQLVSTDDDHAAAEESSLNEDGFAKDSGMIVQKGNAHKPGAAYKGGPESQSAGGSAQQKGPTGLDGSAQQEGIQAGESFEAWAERKREAAEKNATQEGLDAPEFLMPQDPSAKKEDAAGWQGLTLAEQEEQSRKRKGTLTAPIMESEQPGIKPGKEYKITGSRHEDLSKQSIIVRGTQQALDETLNLKGEEAAQAVEKASNIACITVQSPKFNGYLVCAMGKDRKMDKSLIDTIQKRLTSFLRANGETITEKETLDMKIQEVDFTDWALEQAQFLRRSVHDGDEVAMAFFPTNDLEVMLEDSASEKMVRMSLDDLKENVVLEFDLYIYMPENNKYLLYTPQGQPFYGAQKGRLKEKGVNHMHLRRDSSHNVKKYRAQNFLNEKIEAFKLAKKIKTGAS